MKHVATLIASAALVLPAVASAQQAQPAAPATAGATATGSTPVVGATVYDTSGGEVGRVDSLAQGAVVIDTGTNKVAVPATSIGAGAKGPTMAMTKSQLDAAYQQQAAQAQAGLQAKLVAGTAVSGVNGAPVGTIKAADAEFVTLTTTKGDVKLPVKGFSTGPSGNVIIGMTAAQLDAAISGAAAATPAPAATSTPQ